MSTRSFPFGISYAVFVLIHWYPMCIDFYLCLYRLQKFKLNIANTIISQENASLASMGTDQLLDLFSLDENAKKQRASAASANQKSGIKAILDGLDELWDETQYENEYNLDTFMQALKK